MLHVSTMLSTYNLVFPFLFLVVTYHQYLRFQYTAQPQSQNCLFLSLLFLPGINIRS